MTTAVQAPTRLGGVDAARGLAVLGMVAVHVLPRTDDDGGPSLPYVLASGRAAAAFAVLAGVGVALATARAGEGRALQRGRLLVRAAAVGAVGLTLGALETGVLVILAYYAVFFVLLLPFLGWPPRRLLVTAGLVAVAAPVLGFALRPSLTGLDGGNPTWGSLASPVRLASDLLLTGVYPAVPWSAYLLTGLAVGRLALGSDRTAAALAAVGAALAVGAWALSELLLGPLGGADALAGVLGLPDVQAVEDVLDDGQYGSVPTDSWWWLAVASRHSSTTLDLVGTTGTALLALGLCLLLVPRAGGLLEPLTAVGSMPLTTYSAHLLVLHLTDAGAPVRSYVLQVAGALVLATLWRRAIGRGPLEAAVAAAARTVRAPT